MRPICELSRVLAALCAAALPLSVLADEPKPVETKAVEALEVILVEEGAPVPAAPAPAARVTVTHPPRVHVLTDDDLQKLDPPVREAVEKILKEKPMATPAMNHLILRDLSGVINLTAPVPSEAPAKAYRYMIGCTIEQKYREVASESGEENTQAPDGVTVTRTIPESPADAAGIKEGDIVVKVGKTETKTIEVLLDAVDASEGKEIEITLLREGEELKAKVTPRERPQDFLFSTVREAESQAEAATLNRWVTRLQSPHVDEFLAMGVHPAIVMAYTQSVPLPDGMTVIVKRTGNHPADITVEQGKNKWTVKETEIAKLPPDVVPHIQRMLAPHPPFRGELNQKLSPAPQVRTQYRLPQNPTRLKVQAIPATPAAPAGDLKAIQRQLKELQKAIDALEKKQSGEENP